MITHRLRNTGMETMHCLNCEARWHNTNNCTSLTCCVCKGPVHNGWGCHRLTHRSDTTIVNGRENLIKDFKSYCLSRVNLIGPSKHQLNHSYQNFLFKMCDFTNLREKFRVLGDSLNWQSVDPAEIQKLCEFEHEFQKMCDRETLELGHWFAPGCSSPQFNLLMQTDPRFRDPVEGWQEKERLCSFPVSEFHQLVSYQLFEQKYCNLPTPAAYGGWCIDCCKYDRFRCNDQRYDLCYRPTDGGGLSGWYNSLQ